jgi:hypothetical protein
MLRSSRGAQAEVVLHPTSEVSGAKRSAVCAYTHACMGSGRSSMCGTGLLHVLAGSSWALIITLLQLMRAAPTSCSKMFQKALVVAVALTYVHGKPTTIWAMDMLSMKTVGVDSPFGILKALSSCSGTDLMCKLRRFIDWPTMPQDKCVSHLLKGIVARLRRTIS